MITLLGGLVVAAGLFLTVWSIGRSRQPNLDSLSARLKVYDAPADGPYDEREMHLRTTTFSERVIAPQIERIGRYLASRTSNEKRQALRGKLELAGRPLGLTPERFLSLRIGAGVTCFVVGLGLGVLTHNPMIESLGAAVGAGLGYYYPSMWLKQKIGGRQKEIQMALPDGLDLLTIAVEAGLSFDLAVQRLVQKFKNALGAELAQVQSEVQLGRPRLEALDAMGRRCGVDDLHNFVQAVIQSEQMGVGIGRILRLQSDEIRRKRRQRAQEKAAQATLKMMLPMVGCIFPTLWIVLLGPAILILIQNRGQT